MEMNQPIGRTPLDDRPDGLVGKPLDRVDGPLKVTGRAPYAYESRALKDPAYGYIVTSTIAAGTIKAIDADAARRAPGAILVMTHENVPEQGEKKEQVWPQLQGREITFYGQPVAIRRRRDLRAGARGGDAGQDQLRPGQAEGPAA